ncbi:hypothetical protein P4O66_020446, partial [Electrophorus voltai]
FKPKSHFDHAMALRIHSSDSTISRHLYCPRHRPRNHQKTCKPRKRALPDEHDKRYVVNLFKDMFDDEGNDPFPQEEIGVNSDSHDVVRLYLHLTNGVYLNEVMRIIDPNPKVEEIYQNVGDDKILRVQNFSILNRHLRSYYQENLQQLVLMPLPNVAVLGRDPLTVITSNIFYSHSLWSTEGAMEELRRLLLLLLGCAVQCETKETFIQQIQSLDIETQADLALCIQEVTQDPSAVLPLQYGDVCALDGLQAQDLLSSLARQIQGLLAQRDAHLERIAELCVQCEVVTAPAAPPTGLWDSTPEGLSIQLADSKAKLRRFKQELEDKEDQLLDYKYEIQTVEEELKRLQCENRALQGEVRVSRGLRDELDFLREKAARTEQLQMELKSCTHRLRSLDLYRTQLKEQQQYCASLQENKALLEEQLADVRARCSALRELEKDSFLTRQKLTDTEAERDVERQRVDELLEMNMSLQVDLKRLSHVAEVIRSASHPHALQSELESDEELHDTKRPRTPELKPLSVEVDEASSLRLLGAENENAELRRRLECMLAEQEGNAPEVKEALQSQTDRFAQLEEEHQNTLREFQNLRNENSSLKRSLEELKVIQSLGEKEGEGSAGEVEQVISRGECEGKDNGRENQASRREARQEGVMRSQREDGEGEEVFLGDRKEEVINEAERKERGEAEGEKWMEGRKKKTASCLAQAQGPSDVQRDAQKSEQGGGAKDVEGKLSQEALALASQLQQAEEEGERQAALIQELRSKLGEQMRKGQEAGQKLLLLEAESQRLRKAAESLSEAKKEIESLQCESMHKEEELMRLQSQVELQKLEAAVIPQLEGERAALERERDTLKATIDSLRAVVRKSEQFDLTNQTLKAELERLGRSLDSGRRREEELEAELRESGLEVESLSKGRDQAMLEVVRLEQEKEACQSELDSQRREQRQREREMARLRQQLESTASALEHGNQRACSLEVQHRRACHELAQLKETCSQLEELQKEKQQLNVLNAENSAQITSLTQELASERVQSQRLSSQVVQLNQSLEELEAKMKMTTAQLQIPRSSAGSEVTAPPSHSDTEAVTDLKPIRQSPVQRSSSTEVNAGSVRSEHSDSLSVADYTTTLEDNRQDTNREAQEPEKERLINTEKENAVLQREREVLLSQLEQSQAACAQLREQLDTLQRHSISLQENCAKLQDLNTKLQVEQASLSSQHATVLARCRESEMRCATLEVESKVWQKERDESAVRSEALRRDHERLTALQQRQEVELEELLAKHRLLKSSSRNMEAQYKDLEARYMNLQKEWVQVQAELLAQVSVLRGEMSTVQLERTRLEGELNALKEQNQKLDLSNVRLNSQYQLLTQLKGNMDEENRHLVEQNQSLAKENRALLERSLESRDQHHIQQKEYLDKLNELRREKQKLVEKIMDQYRVLEPGMLPPKQPKSVSASCLNRQYVLYVTAPLSDRAGLLAHRKTNWIADRMKKLIKPKAGREGRAQFIAAGSVENLAEAGDAAPASSSPIPAHACILPISRTALEQDPRSAPSSPMPLRRVASQGETEEQPKVVLRTATRRKLGSRHGWGMGRGRDNNVSQSFSPGDQRTPPRTRFRSPSSALWEGENDSSPTPSEEGRGESEESVTPEHSDVSRVSSGAEEQ